jgi:hypothetical protein
VLGPQSFGFRKPRNPEYHSLDSAKKQKNVQIVKKEKRNEMK